MDRNELLNDEGYETAGNFALTVEDVQLIRSALSSHRKALAELAGRGELNPFQHAADCARLDDLDLFFKSMVDAAEGVQ